MVCSVEKALPQDRVEADGQVRGRCNNPGDTVVAWTKGQRGSWREVARSSAGHKEDWTVERR